SQGGFSEAPLIQGRDGFLYGTTAGGGAFYAGTFFRIDLSGNFLLLHSFDNYAQPSGRLIQASDGNFYGTTLQGGRVNGGTIYKFDTAGNFTQLHDFDYYTEGGTPRAGLTQGSDGYFYGTTWSGGAGTRGTVFRMDGAGNVTVLHTLPWDAGEGIGPWTTLTEGSDGNIYGVAHTGGQFGGGTVYRMDHGGNVTVLHNLGTGYDGSAPPAGVIQGSDGALYGTTEQGPGYGNFRSGGVIFRLDVGLSPGDQAPAITSASTTTFTVGSAGTFSVTTTGTPTVVAITETGALPSGVTFTNNRNGT